MQGDDFHDVAEQTGQKRGAEQRTEFFQLKDIYHGRQDEGAAADGDAREQVKTDPESPMGRNCSGR